MSQAIRGHILVPERYDLEHSQALKLPFLVHKARVRNAGAPIYYLNGGPGVSNFSAPLPSGLLNYSDMVRLEYRGVGKASKLLSSGNIGRILTKVGDHMNWEAGKRLAPEVSQAFNRLGRNIDLEGYSIDAIVEDLENLRRYLKHDRIHLLGHSFGTRIALEYMARYPQHVDRALLAAPNPRGRFIWSPAQTDELIKTYAELYQRRYPRQANLYEVMHKVVAGMPRRYMGMRIYRAKVQLMAHMLMFNPFGAQQVFDCFQAMWKGDAGGLAFLSQSYDRLLPHLFTWGAFFAMGISADYDPERLATVEKEGADSILGCASGFLFGSASETVFPKMARPHATPYQSDVPTLFLTGALDASTPPKYVDSDLLPGMPNGEHVCLRGMGHVGPMYNQPDALRHLAAQFLYNGKVSAERFYTREPSLKPAFNVPLLAKTGLGFAALLASSLVFRLKNR